MAMMNYDAPQVAKEWKEAFGTEITELNQVQLAVLVKLMKHVRGRCRNNLALYNYLGRNFSQASFRDVEKTDGKGGTYEGLEIRMK